MIVLQDDREAIFEGPSGSENADILEMCIQIETARAHLFYGLLRLFSEPPEVRTLWWNLCEEGYQHTAALAFIKREVELEPEVSKFELRGVDQDWFYHHLRLVERYERRARNGRMTLDDAFRIALRLKVPGADPLYDFILRGVDPVICEMAFVRPIQYRWLDLAKTIEACSTDEALLARVRQIMYTG